MEIQEALVDTTVMANSSDFRFFFLKQEILKAIDDFGFIQPSDVVKKCLLVALSGQNILCVTKSDVGKCTVFILATLQQVITAEAHTHVLVITYSIESVSQIEKLYRRLSKYLATPLNIELFTNVSEAIKARDQTLETTNYITVGTFDCILELIKTSKRFENVQTLILNVSDDMVDQLDVHSDVDELYKRLPELQQIMLFSENSIEKIRKILQNINKEPSPRAYEFVDNSPPLQKYYVRMSGHNKVYELVQLLVKSKFFQCVVFVNSETVSKRLAGILSNQNVDRLKAVTELEGFQNMEKMILITHVKQPKLSYVDLVVIYDAESAFYSFEDLVPCISNGVLITFLPENVDMNVAESVKKHPNTKKGCIGTDGIQDVDSFVQNWRQSVGVVAALTGAIIACLLKFTTTQNIIKNKFEKAYMKRLENENDVDNALQSLTKDNLSLSSSSLTEDVDFSLPKLSKRTTKNSSQVHLKDVSEREQRDPNALCDTLRILLVTTPSVDDDITIKIHMQKINDILNELREIKIII